MLDFMLSSLWEQHLCVPNMSVHPHARVMEADKQSYSQMNVNEQYLSFQGNSGLKYGPGVDLWSAGVILFILLAGYPPFFHESEPALYALIREANFTFDDPIWEKVSDRCAPIPCAHLQQTRYVNG